MILYLSFLLLFDTIILMSAVGTAISTVNGNKRDYQILSGIQKLAGLFFSTVLVVLGYAIPTETASPVTATLLYMLLGMIVVAAITVGSAIAHFRIHIPRLQRASKNAFSMLFNDFVVSQALVVATKERVYASSVLSLAIAIVAVSVSIIEGFLLRNYLTLEILPIVGHGLMLAVAVFAGQFLAIWIREAFSFANISLD